MHMNTHSILQQFSDSQEYAFKHDQLAVEYPKYAQICG